MKSFKCGVCGEKFENKLIFSLLAKLIGYIIPVDPVPSSTCRKIKWPKCGSNNIHVIKYVFNLRST